MHLFTIWTRKPYGNYRGYIWADSAEQAEYLFATAREDDPARFFATRMYPLIANACYGSSDEDAANARLIAAAPDLLAALENIANYTTLVAGDSAERLSAMVAARAAIRKAKGE